MVNTGRSFEECIFKKVEEKCNHGNSNIPYLHKKYYSMERQGDIIPDITIEKMVDGHLFLIIVIECKDYSGSLSVSEVEEFHSKLQQIGADNTKGIIVMRNGKFQKSAYKYAKSKGISLAIYNDNENENIVILGCRVLPFLYIYKKKKSLFVKIIEIPLNIIKGIYAIFELCIAALIEHCIQIYMRQYDFERIINKYLKD